MRGPYPAPLEAHPLSGCAKEPFHEGRAPGGTGLALAFRTLLSFQGTSPGCSSATRSRFPRLVLSPERRGRYHGPLEIVKDFPPDRSVLLAECCPPRRRRHTEAPPRARTLWASGRPPKAVGWNPLGVRRPPVFRCRRRWRRPGEVLGPEELPCLQLGDGSTVRDGVSTDGRQQRQRIQRPDPRQPKCRSGTPWYSTNRS